MSEKLRPCPFCGGEARFETYGGTACAVVCQSCHCGTPTMSLVDGTAAVNRWNLRTERTCHYVGDEISGGCSECRGWLDPACSYCPSCGARVLDEEVKR